LPKVSVIIPFYNCPYIGEAVQSALKQTHRNIEVIVVDDGSERYRERLAPYYSSVRYIRKENGGTASALNRGIQHAEGGYVAWLSSDDVFEPNKIERQLAFLSERGGRFSFTRWKVIDAGGNVINPEAGSRFRTVTEFYRHMAMKGNAVNGCTVMMRKDLLSSVGLFNENLPYTHDYDLWIRVILGGHDLHYLHDTLTKYRHHSKMGSKVHTAKIAQEIETTMHRYQSQLNTFIKKIEKGGSRT
jgi:teichuronic acid biosynthesis glycosyltransferase TuaG